MPWRSILCGVDFSDASRRALRLAAALAGRYASALAVATVDDPLLAQAAAMERGEASATDDTLRELEEFVRQTLPEPHPWLRAQLLARVGRPDEALLELAVALPADLIVVGTHGMRGIEKVFFGSTTERLLRSTRLPVLAAPPRGEERFGLIPRPVFDLGAIVAPIDLEEGSLDDARVAAAMAAEFNVPLVLMHVIETGWVPMPWRKPVGEVVRHVAEGAHRRLEELAAQVGKQIATEVRVETGSVAEEIARVTVERRAGLIVMGLRSKRGLHGAGPGTVTYRVLCLAPAPILALPKGYTSRESGADSTG